MQDYETAQEAMVFTGIYEKRPGRWSTTTSMQNKVVYEQASGVTPIETLIIPNCEPVSNISRDTP